MFIKYNGTNVHSLPHVQTRQVRLKNKKTGNIRFETRLVDDQSPNDVKWLRPGWNEFPSEVWKQNEKSPSIQMMIKKRLIEFLKEEVTVKEGKKSVKKIIGMDDEEVDLLLISPDRAIRIVKDTYDRDILQRWLDEDNRSKVKAALRKQIKPLLGEEKEEKEEDDDGDDFNGDYED